MAINLPPAVMALWERLSSHGETLLVGGLVRDHFIGASNDDSDYDFASILKPDEMTAILQPIGYTVIPTGIEYGTVTILVDGGHKVEVTTFRGESFRSGSRKPDVFFSRSFEDDSSRRDFTICSMGVRLDGSIVDHHDGLSDIDAMVVRAVGNPVDRFTEDPLRILRGIRFASKFGFSIENDTLSAMGSTAHLTATLSRERVTDELRKILLTPSPAMALLTMKATGVLSVLFPELDGLELATHKGNQYHVHDAWGHTIHAVSASQPNYLVRLAVLYHDVGKPATEVVEDGVTHYYGHEGEGADIWREVAIRDKYSTEFADRIAILIENHLRPARFRDDSNSSLRRLYRKIGDDWAALAEVSRADVLAHANPDLSNVDAFTVKMAQVSLTAIPPRAVVLPKGSGNAIMGRFKVEGKRVGELVKIAEDAVIEGLFEPSTAESVADYLWNNHLDCRPA